MLGGKPKTTTGTNYSRSGSIRRGDHCDVWGGVEVHMSTLVPCYVLRSVLTKRPDDFSHGFLVGDSTSHPLNGVHPRVWYPVRFPQTRILVKSVVKGVRGGSAHDTQSPMTSTCRFFTKVLGRKASRQVFQVLGYATYIPLSCPQPFHILVRPSWSTHGLRSILRALFVYTPPPLSYSTF